MDKNGPFMDDLSITMVMVNSYIRLSEDIQVSKCSQGRTLTHRHLYRLSPIGSPYCSLYVISIHWWCPMNIHELYQENSFEHSAHQHVCWINWSILAKICISTIHSWFHHLHITAPCLWPKNISCSGLTSFMCDGYILLFPVCYR